ncbi:hypothetical protein [Endozoicomonas sp. ONNA2]|uniref:hypothetical protein n=1 Tax=Endozoicomonas sp. ONNA2 TaxID=2828741 RepID=UPI0021493CD9|nr:hypothetical protein [Endozoicomonas sp. ONNA2]
MSFPVNNQRSDYPPPSYDEVMAAGSVTASGVAVIPETQRMLKLQKLADQYEFSNSAVCKLRQLENYHIVVIADDSSSMTHHARRVSEEDPFGYVPSRWDELCRRVGVIIDLATTLNKDGLDIYFFNRGTFRNITDPEKAREYFEAPPAGNASLRPVYEQVVRDNQRTKPDSKVLIFIVTDAEPTQKDTQCLNTSFDGWLKFRDTPRQYPISIMVFKDSQIDLDWINTLDRDSTAVNFSRDYLVEKRHVEEVQQQKHYFELSEKQYLLKFLLGAIDPVYDRLDTKELTSEQLAEYWVGESSPQTALQQLKQCILV